MKKSLLFIFVILISSYSLSYSQGDKFIPIAALQNSSFVYGTYSIKSKKIQIPAFSLNNITYILQLNDLNKKMPKFNTTSMGFYKNYVILGLNETNDYRKSWLFMVKLDKEPKIVDTIKFNVTDGYSYDFYTDLPLIDVPKNIQDLDNDRLPEVLLDFYERQFRILLSVSDKGLSVDYSSPYYVREYNNLVALKERDEYEEREFVIYSILSNKSSEDDILKKLVDDNKRNRKNYPLVISKAIELKNIADRIGAKEYLSAYFSNEIEAQEIVRLLDEKNVDSSGLMFELFNFEKMISQFHLDEMAFNDFILYFSDNISQDKLKEYTSKSLSSFNGDMYSIISNIKELDSNLHKDSVNQFQFVELK